MRALAYLNRRYTAGRFAALLVPALAVLFGVQLAAIAAGAGQFVAAGGSLALSLATYFAMAAIIDRRARQPRGDRRGSVA